MNDHDMTKETRFEVDACRGTPKSTPPRYRVMWQDRSSGEPLFWTVAPFETYDKAVGWALADRAYGPIDPKNRDRSADTVIHHIGGRQFSEANGREIEAKAQWLCSEAGHALDSITLRHAGVQTTRVPDGEVVVFKREEICPIWHHWLITARDALFPVTFPVTAL